MKKITTEQLAAIRDFILNFEGRDIHADSPFRKVMPDGRVVFNRRGISVLVNLKTEVDKALAKE